MKRINLFIYALIVLSLLACSLSTLPLERTPTPETFSVSTESVPTMTPVTSATPEPTPTPAPELERTETGLAVYRLTMNPTEWETLITGDPETLGNTEFEAIFSSNEVTLPATLRLRGASTRYYTKKSFKIKFKNGADFLGRKELNLLASAYDPSFLLEKFSYDVMGMAGALASRAEHVELHVNDAYYGLMTDVESVSSKSFLPAHGLEEDATIYRTGWYFNFRRQATEADYQAQYEKVTNEDDPSSVDAMAFIEGINRVPDNEFAAWLSARMDVPLYLDYLIGSTLISYDYIEHSRSFLIHENGSDRWYWSPWDLNNSTILYGRFGADGYVMLASPPYINHTALPFTAYEYVYHRLTADEGPNWAVLPTRVIDTPEFRNQFISRLETALNTVFTEEALFPYIDAMYAALEPSALADPFADPASVQAGPEWFKQYVTGRRAYLLAQLSALQALEDTGLVVSEIGAGFVELYNTRGADYDLSGYYLSSDLHAPNQQYAFPAGSIVPAGSYWVVTDFAFDPSAGGEIGLFKPPSLEAALAGDHAVMDMVYYPPLTADESYARASVSSENWGTQTAATPGY